MASTIVIVSSYPPRVCSIAAFCKEAREFIAEANPKKEVLVVSHTDGRGDGVLPLIEMNRADWWKVAARRINDL